MSIKQYSIEMPSFLDYMGMSENKKTYLKMKMLCEDGDEEVEKDAPINKDMLDDFGQQLIKASGKYAKQMTKSVVEKLADIVKIDAKKLCENSSMKKILDMLEKIFTPDSSETLTPITVVYYKSTDVYLGLYLKTKKGLFKKIFGMLTSVLGNSPFQLLFVPFNMQGGEPKLATSGNAITQMCMTIFLSDIDCDVVWPFKMKSNWFIKALDFICPSLVDLLSFVTFGGASVAGRLVKYGTKTGVKIGKSVAKKVTKVTTRVGAKVGGKTGAKVAKKLAKSGLDKVDKKLSKLTKIGKKTGKSAGEKAFDKAVGKLPKKMQKKANELKKMAGTSRKAKEFIR